VQELELYAVNRWMTEPTATEQQRMNFIVSVAGGWYSYGIMSFQCRTKCYLVNHDYARNEYLANTFSR